ncbi:MAG: AAA family ATPase [Thermoanaerobaculia bacterium]
MGDSTFLTRVLLENYKSIARCDVTLGPLTFLVGPNGSGKSNFLDALRFVADALRTALDHAIRDRGGFKEVRRRSRTHHPTHFGIRLEFTLPSGQRGFYSFRIGARREAGYEVQREECLITTLKALEPDAHYHVDHGKVVSTSVLVAPKASADRLYLVNASGLPEFREVFELLSNMGFYNLNPDEIRDLQPPDVGEILSRDGDNIASVLGQLTAHNPRAKGRIEEYLGKVVSGIQTVDARSIGSKETLEFRQQIAGSKQPWRFLASSMSDGTLRAVGVLVALFQSSNGERDRERKGARVPLVGIEEPEVALHPAAAGVLLEALIDASHHTQILVTSHSPELLDDHRILPDSILAVVANGGITSIAPLDEVGRSALRDRLYTPGELLKLNQLSPDPAVLDRISSSQMNLFKKSLP